MQPLIDGTDYPRILIGPGSPQGGSAVGKGLDRDRRVALLHLELVGGAADQLERQRVRPGRATSRRRSAIEQLIVWRSPPLGWA